jgi:predicted nuclease of restriction endonuclease-like RecB superfamily
MSKQRVKPVDSDGRYITGTLKNWKIKHPNDLWFHSPFEWRCYIKLQKRKWKFSCQPTAIELIPSFKCTSFVKGKIIIAKVQDAVYTPDFLIETEFGNVYIECKGYFDDTARIRFKMCQYTLNNTEGNVILLIKDDLSFDRLLSLIDSHFNFKTNKKIEL